MFDTSNILSSRKNTTQIWQYFEQYFSSVTGLLLYNPVFPIYVYQGLKELWEDNIQHFEIRAVLEPVKLDDYHFLKISLIFSVFFTCFPFSSDLS